MESNQPKLRRNVAEDNLFKMYEFGSLLKRRRETSKTPMELSEIAKEIGVQVSTLEKWEEGMSFPQLKDLPKILSAYRIKHPEDVQKMNTVFTASLAAFDKGKTYKNVGKIIDKPKPSSEGHHPPGVDGKKYK